MEISKIQKFKLVKTGKPTNVSFFLVNKAQMDQKTCVSITHADSKNEKIKTG